MKNPPLLTLEAVRTIRLKVFENDGLLVPVDGLKDLPFAIARIFYVYGVPAGKTRGKHAHYLCHQVMVCVTGSLRITCTDGVDRREFLLDSKSAALHVPPTIWAEETYLSADAVLLVMTDREYEVDDYIREYDEFTAFRRMGSKDA
jgi:dTDP-4-dehydrorhamnose 3,5-epimerase-like enzyme